MPKRRTRPGAGTWGCPPDKPHKKRRHTNPWGNGSDDGDSDKLSNFYDNYMSQKPEKQRSSAPSLPEPPENEAFNNYLAQLQKGVQNSPYTPPSQKKNNWIPPSHLQGNALQSKLGTKIGSSNDEFEPNVNIHSKTGLSYQPKALNSVLDINLLQQEDDTNKISFVKLAKLAIFMQTKEFPEFSSSHRTAFDNAGYYTFIVTNGANLLDIIKCYKEVKRLVIFSHGSLRGLSVEGNQNNGIYSQSLLDENKKLDYEIDASLQPLNDTPPQSYISTKEITDARLKGEISFASDAIVVIAGCNGVIPNDKKFQENYMQISTKAKEARADLKLANAYGDTIGINNAKKRLSAEEFLSKSNIGLDLAQAFNTTIIGSGPDMAKLKFVKSALVLGKTQPIDHTTKRKGGSWYKVTPKGVITEIAKGTFDLDIK